MIEPNWLTGLHESYVLVFDEHFGEQGLIERHQAGEHGAGLHDGANSRNTNFQDAGTEFGAGARAEW